MSKIPTAMIMMPLSRMPKPMKGRQLTRKTAEVNDKNDKDCSHHNKLINAKQYPS